jgi:peptidoglycan/LPS O-acetylase OafA/YrhL
MRRVLRIWPLYFLIIILTLFVLPHFDIISWPEFSKETIHENLFSKLILFIFFLPNLVLCTFGIIPFASQTWSIGAEEQFYLIWPLLLKFFKKNRMILMISIIFGYHYLIKFLTTNFFQTFANGRLIRDFSSSFHIDSMAIGAVFAVILFQKNKILKYLMNNYLFHSTLILTTVLIFNGYKFPHFHNISYSFLFAILIINFAANEKIKISLENNILNYLGTISYGLYMYHPLSISIVIVCCKSVGLVSNWLIYPASILLTIALAGLSYKYFETYFLKFKHKFSKLISGNHIK